MNLAGNQAKQLFKSLRSGSSPSVVGMWAAATAVDQMRKRGGGSRKELIASKELKPGESYVIRMPGEKEGALADSLTPGARVARIETSHEGSIASQLFSTATDLLGVVTREADEANPTRQRRKTSLVATPAEEPAPQLSRRQQRKADRTVTEEPAPQLSRRQQRKAKPATTEAVGAEDAPNGSLSSTLLEVAASFMGSDDKDTEVVPVTLSRRARRDATRLASLEEAEFEREALPRRQRRKLDRAERRARQRPSGRRIRRARHHQQEAAKTYAKIERRAKPSRRKRRKTRAAQRNLEYRQARVEKRSTRRRRRQLRKAEKTFQKLS